MGRRRWLCGATGKPDVEPNQDADGDGMPDDWEKHYGLNPNNAADRNGDLDDDEVTNWVEFRYRTHPALVSVPGSGGQFIDIRPGIDTDGDGLPNVWEWKHELDYDDAADAHLDSDGDGLTNFQEFRLGTKMNGVDSDGDGVSDWDEIMVNFTNPLSATDADGDGIPDDFEKHLAKQLLDFQPDSAYWNAAVPGQAPAMFAMSMSSSQSTSPNSIYDQLIQGDLDPNQDYTGEGLTALELAKWLRSHPRNEPLKDGLALVDNGPIPRFALFPIGFQPEYPDPFQISDKGRVLYRTGSWCAGVWTSLIAPPVGSQGVAQPAHAYAINDNDVILGEGTYKVSNDPEYHASMIYYWKTPAAAPLPVKNSQNLNDGYAGRFVGDYYYHDFAPRPVLSNDGRFSAVTREWSQTSRGTYSTGVQGSDGILRYENTLPLSVWTLPAGTGDIATEAVGTGSHNLPFHQTPGLTWGYTTAHDASGNEIGPRKGKVFAPAELPDLPFEPYNVFSTSNGILALAPSHLEQSPKLFTRGSWQNCPSYKYAIDISADGIAIGKPTAGKGSPVLLNGKWAGMERCAPLPPGVTVTTGTWWDGSCVHLDTTPRGWILSKRYTLGGSENSVMLPITLKGIDKDPVLAPGATGVDEFSIRSDAPGSSVQDRNWIMVPLTEGQTKFTLKSPVNPNAQLTLKLASEEIHFDGATEKNLTTEENVILIDSVSTNKSSRDAALDLSLGTVASLSKPIGVKLMKDRTVRVKPFLITKRTVTTPDPAHPDQHLTEYNSPGLTPSVDVLEQYLNAVFEPQLNIKFVVAQPTVLQLEWDKDGDGSADPPSETNQDELQPMLDLAVGYVGDADIQIFLLGTERKIYDDTARGYTNNNKNACWIVADTLANSATPGSGLTLYEVEQTIAHEIGHVMVGEGHPDKGDDVAPLPGTNHLERLMLDGGSLPELNIGGVARSAPRRHRLVKREWDEAEKWLSSRKVDQ